MVITPRGQYGERGIRRGRINRAQRVAVMPGTILRMRGKALSIILRSRKRGVKLSTMAGLVMFRIECCPESVTAALIQINGNRSGMEK